ncbi:oxygenase MpaB family protein [Nocardia sp. NPDC049526]|uniref:oxygenase MpaB family protein n=1 Tax=Nocardia sp. NPDC049526 TaxID=3364316 RepID=UPI00379DCDB4
MATVEALSAPAPIPIRTEDYGFFGPDSPSWRVWTSPTTILAFQRWSVVHHFDPFVTAGLADAGEIFRDPRGRADRTLAYGLRIAIGDGRTAVAASDRLLRIHAKSVGIEPVTGRRYNGNSPDAQLYTHVTVWHSVLKCYEMFGPGPLPPKRERQFWAECATAAELQTCRRADVPLSRDGVREYLASVRPRLCVTERAREGIHFVLRTPRARAGFVLSAVTRWHAPAVIATLPRWMRALGGFEQSAAKQRSVVPLVRAEMRVLRANRVLIPIFDRVVPETGAILRDHHRDATPASAELTMPADIRGHLRAGGNS